MIYAAPGGNKARSNEFEYPLCLNVPSSGGQPYPSPPPWMGQIIQKRSQVYSGQASATRSLKHCSQLDQSTPPCKRSTSHGKNLDPSGHIGAMQKLFLNLTSGLQQLVESDRVLFPSYSNRTRFKYKNYPGDHRIVSDSHVEACLRAGRRQQSLWLFMFSADVMSRLNESIITSLVGRVHNLRIQYLAEIVKLLLGVLVLIKM
ncbi:hypothetical protein RRG08_049181 [Elysia crispata]|uniref:Uncharacterized protein n=1 Tax=Elysia crispata TaxID=231223 RepID=A0AAE1E3B9_9GAST|nr:hypothetical protein RRG08_049181 [Elysia crispata]